MVAVFFTPNLSTIKPAIIATKTPPILDIPNILFAYAISRDNSLVRYRGTTKYTPRQAPAGNTQIIPITHSDLLFMIPLNKSPFTFFIFSSLQVSQKTIIQTIHTTPNTSKISLHFRNLRRKRAMNGALKILIEAALSWIAIAFPHDFSSKCSVISGMMEGRYTPADMPRIKEKKDSNENNFT